MSSNERAKLDQLSRYRETNSKVFNFVERTHNFSRSNKMKCHPSSQRKKILAKEDNPEELVVDSKKSYK